MRSDAPEAPAGLATPASLADDPGEIRSLTGLRLFAAGWVVLFHFQFTPGHVLAAVLGPVDPLVESGALGVDLFYVLSGFVIAFTYLHRVGPSLRPGAAGAFLWARVCRVWPVYAVVTSLFGLFLLARQVWGQDAVIAYQSVQPSMTVGSWLQQMLMVQIWGGPWHDGASWVGPAWSISAEWLAYLLFPLSALLFFRLRRWPRWVLGAAAVALMAPVAVLCLRTGSPYFPFSWAARVLAGFASGVLVYLVVREIPLTDRVRRVASLVALGTVLAIVAGLVLGGVLGPGPEGAEHGGMVLVLFPLLVGALALGPGGVARLLSSRWAVHGGRISYSLYLVHVALFEVGWTAMAHLPPLRPDGVLGTALAPVLFLGTFLAAHLLWRFVEEPARRGLRRLVPPAPAPAAPPPDGSPAVDVRDIREEPPPRGSEVGTDAVRAE